MLKDFNFILKNIDGSDASDGEESITAKMIAVNALLASPDKNESGEEKLSRYKIAMAINETGSVDLKSEEISLIKKMIGNVCTVLVVGQMYKFLDE